MELTDYPTIWIPSKKMEIRQNGPGAQKKICFGENEAIVSDMEQPRVQTLKLPANSAGERLLSVPAPAALSAVSPQLVS